MLAILKKHNFFLFEIFLIIKIQALLAPVLSSSMLIQDKICLVQHQQSAEFCMNLQRPSRNSEEAAMQELVLADTVKFSNYVNIVETAPILFWSLFLGPFLDTYPNAVYFIFLVNIVGDVFSAVANMALIYFYNSSPYLLLIPSFNVWFTGGLMAFGSTAGLFITSHSEEASRGVRFVALEIFIILGYSGSMFLGGRLLRNRETPTADQPQLRTYYYNFLLMLVFDLASTALLFALYQVMKKKKKASSGCKMVVQSTKESTEIAVVSTNSSTSSTTSNNNKTALQVFFNLDNARQTLAAFFRKRPQNVRMQIFLLVFIEFSQLVLTSGLDGLMITFSQSVYHWSSETFSTVQAVNQIVSMGLLALFSALFITWLGLADSTLILLAQISNFACDLIRGTFLSPLAYFIAIPVGSLTGFGIVCTKAKFSKIVPPGEAGKIFSLNATFEAFVPLGASFIYSYLFTFSFSTYPGLIYHFSCFIMIFTVGALILERRFCPVTGQENAGAEEEEENVDKVDLESAERLPPKNVL